MHIVEKALEFCSATLTVTAVIAVAAAFGLRDRPTLRHTITDWTEDVASGVQEPRSAINSPAVANTITPQLAGESSELAHPQWTDREIKSALMVCMHILAPVTADIVPLAPIGNGSCGSPAPVLLRSVGAKEKVTIDPPLVMNCPMIAALDHWLETSVQPAAHAAFGASVVGIVGSGYACRNRYNRPNDRLSQHAFANAIDLPRFVLADGRVIDVINGWGPTARDLKAATPKANPRRGQGGRGRRHACKCSVGR